ncbi:hypothetical protein [uncultured Campylobacter sp.]|uniref:hypothetical protein n=1 Tax=uncultured Campylobacter sp. TaxID=218934 RepID=UPI002617DE32|nr:hypothetical protein [uncultured Campylobacter sp.]
MNFIKFCIAFLICLSQMATAGSFDLNATLRLGAFDASSHRLLLCGSGGELRMFDTAKWDVEFAQKYSDNEITALNFKNGKIYLAWDGAEIAVLNDRLKFLRTLKTGRSGTAQIDAIYAAKDAIYAVVDKNQLIRLDEDPDNSADGGYAPGENSTANGQFLNRNSAPDGLRGISFHYGRINAVSLGANGLCVASWNGVACFSADIVATKFSGINAAPNRAAQGELNSVKFKDAEFNSTRIVQVSEPNETKAGGAKSAEFQSLEFKGAKFQDEELKTQSEISAEVGDKNLSGSIATALADCDGTLFAGDIEGNFINLKSGERKSVGSWIKSIVCARGTQFIATKDKIYENQKAGLKEVVDLKSEFLAMYADGEAILVVSKSGKILKF